MLWVTGTVARGAVEARPTTQAMETLDDTQQHITANNKPVERDNMNLGLRTNGTALNRKCGMNI